MTAAAAPPYPGPRPFESHERDLFFGRATETRDLVSYIRAQRIILLYASSGAGKTSLINAGVIPALCDAGFDVLPPARVVAAAERRTVNVQNIFVFNVALNWLPDPAETLAQATLSEVIGRHPRERGHAGDERVIFFDQFEEIFTAHGERWTDRQPFFEQLVAALHSDPLLHAVLIMREDFLAPLEPYAPMLPNRLRNRMRLDLLDDEAALDAIKEPMEKLGRGFAPGVAEELVRDLLRTRVEVAPGKMVEVTGEHVEPMQLQLVCRSLWHAMGDDDTVRPEHVKAIGNVDGILRTFYGNAIRAAAAKAGIDELALRNWCETELITTLGTRGMVYRGPEKTGSAPNAAVDELEAQHLIRPERRAGARWYELTHDRFIEPIRASNRQHLASQQDYVQALEGVRRGEELWHRHRFADATAEFKNAWTYALRADAYEMLAYIPFALGAVALDCGDAMSAIKPLDVAANMYRESGENDRAAQVMRELSYAMFRVNRYPEAIDTATQALALTKDNQQKASLYRVRGVAYWYSGQLQLAVADYNEAISRDPKNLNAYNDRGQVHAELKQYQEAVEDLSRVVDSATKVDSLLVAYSLNGRGHAYGGLREFDKAMDDFAASLKLAPNNAWAYLNRARVHHWMGDDKAALADLDTALEKTEPPLHPGKREEAEAIRDGKQPWPS